MPYVIVYEDGQSVELRGSFDSQQGNVLFSKLGLSDRTKTTGKKKDLPDIKCEYFTILERSGYQLVSSNSCHDATMAGKNKIVREYIFHKLEDFGCSASQSATILCHSTGGTRIASSRPAEPVSSDHEILSPPRAAGAKATGDSASAETS